MTAPIPPAKRRRFRGDLARTKTLQCRVTPAEQAAILALAQPGETRGELTRRLVLAALAHRNRNPNGKTVDVKPSGEDCVTVTMRGTHGIETPMEMQITLTRAEWAKIAKRWGSL